MEANKVNFEEGLKWRCKEHPNSPKDIICLDGDAKERVMCFRCLQVNQIPLSNLISMKCVFDAKENDIFETYPPLKDQLLSNKLRHVVQQQSLLLEGIELYFKKLREDFEREMQAAQQRAKEVFINQEQTRKQLLDEYIRIAEIEKLKELIVSVKEEAEKDLDEFIKDKWDKAEVHRKTMYDLMSQIDAGQHFFSDKPNRIAEKMIKSLKKINFFEQSILTQISLIQSTYDSSQYLSITKINNSIYQIKQEASGGWGQVYLNPILNPLSKYIMQIELETKTGNSNNYFFAGIVKDEGKDNDYAFNQNMCYYDYSNHHGITKYIKGNPMQSGSKSIGKHSFEFRIHLDQKLLRVASLPDYTSIAELDDPNKINLKVNYRFFLAAIRQDNMIRINDVRVVDKFDEKM